MEQYDIIVLGTGLKKCILSGLLSQSGKRFFTLTGILTMEERVHHFLPFKSFTGSLRFLVLISQWAVEKNLMGMFDKRKLRKLLLFALNFDKRNPRSYQDVDPNKMTTRDLFCRFDLGRDVMEFTAHAIALHNSERSLDQPCGETLRRIRRYTESLSHHNPSPYIYPVYGLGELPQGFSRLSADYGGAFLLSTAVDEIVMDDGKVKAVKCEGKLFHCKQLICDPSYVPHRVRKVERVIRVICLLNHPVKNTHEVNSCQIIMPQTQPNRTSDIYISVVSYAIMWPQPGCPSPQ
ncbi:hypothetical protein CesoFtcFv8_002352 [Champsocephalus esox]|uniref:Rab GDP dissociation inhibitor n=1 Tax=Champsocephalus esox TaxID=159716 RepID=A0AAN8HDV4_9TELE|nr:hypothetical protein CesoFtcFv8_002352 [Champsocephalus esox]